MRATGLDGPAWPLVDTLILAREAFANRCSSFGLESLCATFGITNRQPHRALADAHAENAVLDLLLSDRDMEALLAACGGKDLLALTTLPLRYELMLEAIAAGRDVEIDYKGLDKPASIRRIKPLYASIGRGGALSVMAYCYRDGTEKRFRLERMRRIST
jgi:DNA polymerase III epsilon subunit-like protein